jgi:valyl-tRNA synthetase
MEESAVLDMDKTYEPRKVEEKWYRFWIDKGFFRASTTSQQPPFSIVIPPPNVTGSLHIGHALNNTLQDILNRYKKMKGFNVLWVPGTDHAGIATQTIVERELLKEGIKREDLGREKFVKRVWKWKEVYGKRIIEQLQRLGASCDWSRERFTMDEGFSLAVREAFVRLYNDGLIYRGHYLVNWCPRCETALSDLEVAREETKGKLYYLKYPILSEDGSSDGFVVVATTRPETMLGDTAVAVNPNDSRYKYLVGKEVLLPVVGRRIPIIADDSVDMEMGTGALKITPAHDFTDFEIANRHNLPKIQIMDFRGRMNENAGKYKGLDRFECRARIVEDFEREGILQKIEEYNLQLGKCYRCGTVVEPMLSLQWFVHTPPLAHPAIQAVEEGRTRIIPEGWKNTYFEWMRNIRDWCISRQIWWGHRIPAWFCRDCGGITVSVGEPKVCRHCLSPNIEQETDVLDTWFSSALWPFGVFGWPEQTQELRIFYPTSVLVTSFDILFFWVARMMMMGIRFMGNVPFRDVYIHALVRDEKGEKMSKTKGNVIDPLDIMDEYGADALRFSLTALAAQGRDIRLSLPIIEGYRNFMNKIWNASRFVFLNIDGKLRGEYIDSWFSFKSEELSVADKWILTRLNRVIREVEESLEKYEFDKVARLIYQFIWGDFCDWYIELVKPVLSGNDTGAIKRTQAVLIKVLASSLQLLHPIAPFITEELYSRLRGIGFTLRTPGGEDAESIAVSSYPVFKENEIFEDAHQEIEFIKQVIVGIRNLRAVVRAHPSSRVDVILVPDNEAVLERIRRNCEHIANLSRASVNISQYEKPKKAIAQVVEGLQIFLPVEGLIDVDREMERIKREISKLIKDLEVSQKKLSNRDFLERAPEDVVEKEKEKFEELSKKKRKMEEVLEKLKEVGT